MPLMFLNGTGMAGQATHWIVGDSPLVADDLDGAALPVPRRRRRLPGARGRRPDAGGAQRGRRGLRRVLRAAPRGPAAGRAGRPRARRDRAGRRHGVVRDDPAPTEHDSDATALTDISDLGSWRDYQRDYQTTSNRKRPDTVSATGDAAHGASRDRGRLPHAARPGRPHPRRQRASGPTTSSSPSGRT